MSDWGGEAACGKPLSGFVISGLHVWTRGSNATSDRLLSNALTQAPDLCRYDAVNDI